MINLLLALIIALALLSLAFWAIGYLAPADVQKPLRVIAVAVFLIWIVLHLLPALGVL